MPWEIAKATHIGGQTEQQDRVEILNNPDEGAWLLIVADGMGGHSGGALAAQTVIDSARTIWRRMNAPSLHPHKLLQAIITLAHRTIRRAAEEKGLSCRSACVLLYVTDQHAFWSHVGDSRLYHFRKGQLLERTRDHSVVQLLVDMERVREEEVGTHPDQSSLLKSLGGSKTPEPDFGRAEVRPDDVFLLCSDGLWVHFMPRQIADVLAESSPETVAEFLVNQSVERGGEKGDNVSVIVARSSGIPESDPKHMISSKDAKDPHWLTLTLHIDPVHPPEQVQKIILDAAISAKGVLKDPKPIIHFKGLSNWSADYSLAFCIKRPAKRNIYNEGMWKRVWTHLNQHDIFPAMQRHDPALLKTAKTTIKESFDPLAVLEKVGLFQPFSFEARSFLCKQMRTHRFPPGKTIVRQGNTDDSLFIIVEGLVGIWAQVEGGNSFEVARMGAGNFFGEMALLTGEPRTATIISLTNTYLFEIDKEDIAPLLEAQPEVSQFLSNVLAERKLAAESRLHPDSSQNLDKNDLGAQLFDKIQRFFGLKKVP